jgi:hypothetical protein
VQALHDGSLCDQSACVRSLGPSQTGIYLCGSGWAAACCLSLLRSADNCIDARLTQLSQMRKCSRSPLHRAAAFPLQQLRTLSELSALKMFLEALGQDAFVQ